MTEKEVYLKNRLDGMNNDELILFIYQEMVKLIKQSKDFMLKGNIEKRVITINKAIDVTSYLNSILDFRGGDIAFKLQALYIYSMRKLSEANIEKKIKPLDEVLRIFLDLTSAWMEKMKKDSQEHAKSRIESTPAERSSGLEIYG